MLRGYCDFQLLCSVFRKPHRSLEDFYESGTNFRSLRACSLERLHLHVRYRYHLFIAKQTICFARALQKMKVWSNKIKFRQQYQSSKATLFFCGVALLLSLAVMASAEAQAGQSQASTRKIKLSVPPQYPELAKRMNIQGVARVLLTVTADGKVSDVKELGGNPVLVSSLVQAVKKWRYEAADKESMIEVRFEFK